MEEKNIRKIDSLVEAVRLRPGMYLGGTDGRGMLHAVFLVIACDLRATRQGQHKHIEIALQDYKKFMVKDDGPGLPIDNHPQLKIPHIEALLTSLNCDSEFWPNSPIYSLAFVNAVSAEGNVQTRRDGYVWEQSYMAGVPTGPLKQIQVLNESKSTGNTFTFRLDPTIFDADATISYPDMVVNLRELAYLLPGFKITLRDERQNPVVAQEFHYPNGLADFVQYLNRDCAVMHDVIHSTDEFELRLQNRDPYSILVDFAIQFTDCDASFQLSYANLRETRDGGVHIDTLRRAVCEAITFVARDERLSVPTSADELLRGMTAVIHIHHPAPHYKGCLPVRLINPDVRIVDTPVFWSVSGFFEQHQEALERVLARSSSRTLPIKERRHGEFASLVKYPYIFF